MKLRPTIFLSGVSSEFGSFRDAVEVEVQKKGCFAENQSSFGVDYRTIEEMLRRRINDADAVIHIVGFRFGAEPKDRPADKSRRSYTQMEYDIARELKKPLYVFLSSDANIADALGTDDAEATALQLAHRQTIQDDKPLFYFFKDKAGLCKLAGEIEAVAHADFRVDISRIDKYAPADLIGREDELALLNEAWLKVRRAEPKRPHILTFVALGGEGKTSLVAKWLSDLAYDNWPGCDSAFAWSFYSQGTREQYAASSDLFLKEAITFFGDATDKELAASAVGAYEKGQRLARIVGQRCAVLILDGLEPLQYAPTSPTRGELKDPGITALLKGLAAHSYGLCIVTTRYSLPNLKAFWQTTAPEITLTRLSQTAGVHLLTTLGVKGSPKEFELLVEEVKGHALTLSLLGTYLRDAHDGDIRRRDLIKFQEADTEVQGGHAFRVIKAYEDVFEKEGKRGKRALAILQLLGLFDRPITTDCLNVLLEDPVIPTLTESIVELSETHRNVTLKRLEDAKLITINRGTFGALISLDSHPLLREYFAQQLHSEQPEAWCAAHRRLYEYLRDRTQDKVQPTLEDLQPLYQAVVHGCHAGLYQEACEDVYLTRIRRDKKDYVSRQLGAFGSELGAVACFFEAPWSRPAASLVGDYKAWLLAIAAFDLRALGRLREALEPVRSSLKMRVQQKNWENAAITCSNLTELELFLGEVASAIRNAEQAVVYADRSYFEFQRMARRANYAHALYTAGRWADAETYFREAERIQREREPEYPYLYSMGGYRYCDYLLVAAERATWQRTLVPGQDLGSDRSRHLTTVGDVLRRASLTLEWVMGNLSILTEACHHLTLARTVLCEALLSETALLSSIKYLNVKTKIEDSIKQVRRAGQQPFLALGLLTRAWFRYVTLDRFGRNGAQEDLDEAWEIAERGPMKLHMADIHLYRARLFFRENEYPWESAEADLKAARRLIEQCGYWRRKEELEDAERVILQDPRNNPR